jgi:competence protein ComEA
MKAWWQIILGLISGLLAAGIILLAASPPRGESILLLPSPAPLPLIVHVSGAVLNSGIYTLPVNSRVADAIQAAGGSLSSADTQMINLAAPLEDGTKIWVPQTTVLESSPMGSHTAVPTQESPYFSKGGALVNINTASLADLETLPGIGPATAEKIITYRQEKGPFSTLEAIQNVSGIGPATYERIKQLITISGSS